MLPKGKRAGHLWMVHHDKSYPHDHRFGKGEDRKHYSGYEKIYNFAVKRIDYSKSG